MPNRSVIMYIEESGRWDSFKGSMLKGFNDMSKGIRSKYKKPKSSLQPKHIPKPKKESLRTYNI